MFHRLCEVANVTQLRVHDLRHSCATLLFTMGVQPATVQRILRHSSITVTTGNHVEVIEAVQRDALDSVGTLFAPLARVPGNNCRQDCGRTAQIHPLKPEFSGAKGIRTPDLLDANESRYQLRHSP
jgi:Phage integrase family